MANSDNPKHLDNPPNSFFRPSDIRCSPSDIYKGPIRQRNHRRHEEVKIASPSFLIMNPPPDPSPKIAVLALILLVLFVGCRACKYNDGASWTKPVVFRNEAPGYRTLLPAREIPLDLAICREVK